MMTLMAVLAQEMKTCSACKWSLVGVCDRHLAEANAVKMNIGIKSMMYMIKVENAGNPTVIHDSLLKAETEAKRLCVALSKKATIYRLEPVKSVEPQFFWEQLDTIKLYAEPSKQECKIKVGDRVALRHAIGGIENGVVTNVGGMFHSGQPIVTVNMNDGSLKTYLPSDLVVI